MNGVDLALGLLLAVCALRGYWRGFFRESFGLLALVGGVAAAVRFATLGAALLEHYVRLPAAVDAGLAFVAIFVIVHTMINLIGVLLDRLTAVLFLRGINRLAGAVLGAGKGAAVLALVLLFFHLFPVIPELDGQIMSSNIGRPLVNVAGDVIRLGLQPPAPQDDASSKT
jgi:membrane protein required for colicin V production